LDVDGLPDPWLYNAIRDDVNPYLKAIDSVYLGLTWQRAYTYKNGLFSPPGSAYIHNIWAASIVEGLATEQDPNINPDRGWFHAGEFYDASAKYVMLVNRACSRGPANSTEAPSITAVIKFDDNNLGGEHHYYVIDLATGTNSSDWEGVPETTYTAVMPDGYIPFTTTFKAGEGRLFKIVQAN
jgi:hypothetical protein